MTWRHRSGRVVWHVETTAEAVGTRSTIATYMDVDRTVPEDGSGVVRPHERHRSTLDGDDQSRTWDGRVLDTKGAVLEFLADLEAARHDGRSLEPIDDGA